MVFIDTDILSIFAKIQRLPLLFAVFDQDVLNIAAAVENEVVMGFSKGFPFADALVELQLRLSQHPLTASNSILFDSCVGDLCLVDVQSPRLQNLALEYPLDRRNR